MSLPLTFWPGVLDPSQAVVRAAPPSPQTASWLYVPAPSRAAVDVQMTIRLLCFSLADRDRAPVELGTTVIPRRLSPLTCALGRVVVGGRRKTLAAPANQSYPVVSMFYMKHMPSQ
ncbi:hypothetical protein GN244_ATG00139 [Phytophthora infestans]|uniref:Uncharacterized protein n=1 Tax=Phytophthora infestans TaxID=4787 RepID=A0A833W945_PHYIN|nr:hypothetical protein GN244_ATG00139 [Phytophthora infestans]KAF4142795.1 hypothetical protein GN958_ATG08023 [Phytophthora infestans]